MKKGGRHAGNRTCDSRVEDSVLNSCPTTAHLMLHFVYESKINIENLHGNLLNYQNVALINF